MFCQKCGTKNAEDAAFCQKCGTKIVANDVVKSSASDSVTMVTQTPPEQTLQQEQPASTADVMDFKAFVDNHVRTTTKFRSAEDLLKNAKPSRYMWVCFGVPAIIGLVAGPIGSLLLSLFFGITAVWICNLIFDGQQVSKTTGFFNENINTDELLRFLNEKLVYLNPYLHEWGYSEALSSSTPLNNVKLCALFGSKQKSSAVIHFKYTNEANSVAGQYQYYFSAEMRRSAVHFILSLGIFDLILGPYRIALKYTCLFKTAPILQATMEYYLKSVASQRTVNPSLTVDLK